MSAGSAASYVVSRGGVFGDSLDLRHDHAFKRSRESHGLRVDHVAGIILDTQSEDRFGDRGPAVLVGPSGSRPACLR